ncbi:hypothetical protein QLX08_005345 [Tetragonisca angustula]|uniref:Uncharacterized protein n=1 Tax=Tetragonisca angustula TaxID=166442 RepID=A0AAW0ZY67_9HYME
MTSDELGGRGSGTVVRLARPEEGDLVGGGKTVSLAAGDHFTRKRCPGSLPRSRSKKKPRRNVKPERSQPELSHSTESVVP